MSKHTPGPWHVDDNNQVLDEQSLLVAAEIMGERPEIYKANARLIAAAPDLLEALKGALLSVEWRILVTSGPHGINPDPEGHEALSKFAATCRAAIAKAEGK